MHGVDKGLSVCLPDLDAFVLYAIAQYQKPTLMLPCIGPNVTQIAIVSVSGHIYCWKVVEAYRFSAISQIVM